MSMLAESKSRQKWSDDPRNTRWANDKTKFGYAMLTKMGWSEGKGLGQNLSGELTHIKVKKQTNNSGVGMKKASDDDWISQQDDFNILLSQLNQGITGNQTSSIKCLEDRVRASKKKILYTKFVKSKDLSNASSQDLAAIFGTRSKSAPVTPQISEDDSDAASVVSCPVTECSNEHGITTLHTGVSIQDYFAKKMASIIQKSAVTSSLMEVAEIEEDEQEEKRKKTKKKKKSRDKSDDEEPSFGFKHLDVSSSNCLNTTDTKKKKHKPREKENSVFITTDLSNSTYDVIDRKNPEKRVSKKRGLNEIKDKDPSIIECDAKLSKDKKRKKKLDDSSIIISDEKRESVDIEKAFKKKRKTLKKKGKKLEDC